LLLKGFRNQFGVWPTTFYAKAQDNNHGISEGVALYLLGFFLWKETKRKKYFSLSLKGLKLIENRVQKLIMDDGSFSQYSVVYHRMILDLLSVLELTRQRWGLDSFSREFYNKVKLSVQWYSDIIDPISGNAPNMGGNDGTYLFNYDQKEYRDFRPTLSLASSIFKMPINRDLNVGHILLEIFNISPSILKEERSISKAYIQGGYIKLVRKNGMAFLRVPKYKFKPSHADALHLDIWQDGINWIRDAGSFSYALNIDEQEQYSGTQGHSTIQFDNRNQMPRLSRFLFGDWLSSDQINFNESNNSVCASYTDGKNVKHTRIVNSVINGWQIQDDISGNFKKGVMRWILKPGDWEIEKHSIRNGNISLEIISDHISSFQVIQGFESLFYMEKTQVPILTIEFFDECSINTQVLFTA